MIYPDASVLVPLLISEPLSTVAGAVFAVADSIVVSDFAVGETSSAFARYVRTGARDAQGGTALVTLLDEWVARRAHSIEIQSADVRVGTLFVRRFETGLRLPDAIHLAICRRLGARLFSFDNRMLTAANLLQVPVQQVDV